MKFVYVDSKPVAMSEVQKQTITRYQRFLKAMSLSAVLETALKSGLLDSLRKGQKNFLELAELSRCQPESLERLLGVLIAIGAIERYGDDLALSPATQLLVGPDKDMGIGIWEDLDGYLMGQPRAAASVAHYRRRQAARQWSMTAAAMQAAEVLDIGAAVRGLRVLELGSGAGVWSAAMAYRDPKLHVTVIDNADALAHCRATFAAIELLDRWTAIEDDYRTWSTPLGEFDLVILPEIVQLENDAEAVILLGRAADALRVGGQVVIFETLQEADGPPVPLATHALEIAVAAGGYQRSVAAMESLLRGAGFEQTQWGWLTASPQGIGLVVAIKT